MCDSFNPDILLGRHQCTVINGRRGDIRISRMLEVNAKTAASALCREHELPFDSLKEVFRGCPANSPLAQGAQVICHTIGNTDNRQGAEG